MKMIFLAAVSFASLIAWAAPKDSMGLKFEDARLFAMVKGTTTTAGYVLIKNPTAQDVTLTVSEVVPFKAVEIHETLEKDGRMSMQKIEKFVIKTKDQLELKPGGNHIMLFEPTREIKDGETLQIKFLANGKPIQIPFKVVPRVEKNESHHAH